MVTLVAAVVLVGIVLAAYTLGSLMVAAPMVPAPIAMIHGHPGHVHTCPPLCLPGQARGPHGGPRMPGQ
jgi:hypothetical protein